MPYFFAISIVHHVLALTFNQKSKLIFLVSSGGTIEYYDFALFAIFADVIGETFFPSANHYTSMLGALLVFASGYLVRPLGGVIFSHFGDKYGRQQTFALTIGVMALSTLLMGLLPSYHTAGLSISILFVILRLLQGIALGGEIPGAVTYLLEQFPGRKSLISGIIFGFLSLGILIGNGINNVLAFILEGTQLEGAGWRIAFIIGGIACFLIYQSRKKLSETPAFQAIQEQTLSVPFLTLMSHQKLNIIKGVLMVASIATLVSLTMLYIQPYLSLLHQQRGNHLPPWVVILPMYVLPLSCVFWGWLFDRCNRYRMFGWVLLACIPLSFWFYGALTNGYDGTIPYLLLINIAGMMPGLYPVIISSLFPTNLRYSGIALCYNISYATFGGFTPALATFLIDNTDDFKVPAYLISGISLVGFIVVLSFQRFKQPT